MPNPEHLFAFTGTLTHVAQTGTADIYGDPTEQTTTETVRCWLHQTERGEETATANTQGQTATLLLPAGTTATGLDRITVAGVTWQLVGPPLPAMNPRTGLVSHIEATVRVTT